MVIVWAMGLDMVFLYLYHKRANLFRHTEGDWGAVMDKLRYIQMMVRANRDRSPRAMKVMSQFDDVMTEVASAISSIPPGSATCSPRRSLSDCTVSLKSPQTIKVHIIGTAFGFDHSLREIVSGGMTHN